MLEYGKRVVCAALAGVLAVGGLAACVAQPPKDAKELVERFNATNDHNNYTAETHLAVTMDALGTSGTISYTENAKVAGDNAYATVLTGLSDNKEDKTEMYVEKAADGKYNTYSSSQIGDTTVWYKLTSDASLLCKTLIESAPLSEAKLETTGKGYDLVLPGSAFAETLAGSKNNVSNTLGSAVTDGIKSALSGSDLVYSFDKSCKLTGIAYKISTDANDGSQSAEGNDAMVSGSIELDVTVKDYGKTDAKQTAIPENVKSEAIDATSLIEDVSKVIEDATGTENAEGSTQGTEN